MGVQGAYLVLVCHGCAGYLITLVRCADEDCSVSRMLSRLFRLDTPGAGLDEVKEHQSVVVS